MTTIDLKPGATPAAHALVIGVGKYRNEAKAVLRGLGHLSSPPIAASAFADWLIQRYRHPTATLGSVELLISDSTGPVTFQARRAGGDIAIEPATFAKVDDAFGRWLARCNEHADNVAIMYFCGHGVRKGGHLALLLEDFGKSGRRPFATAIDFEATYAGLMRQSQCRARTQWYFVDSCSQVPGELLGTEGDAAALVEPDIKEVRQRDGAVFLASALAESAYGVPGGSTLFTRALIDGLRGHAAEPNGGEWVVTAESLSRAVKETLRVIDPHEGKRRQRSVLDQVAGDEPIVALTRCPRLPARVSLDPRGAAADAREVALDSLDGTKRLPKGKGSWNVSLPRDTYTFRADFRGQRYRSGRRRIWIDRPYKHEILEVSR